MISFPKDDTNIYLNKESWIVDHDDIRDRFVGFMAPHSNQYFSGLNGIFLFRVKNLKRLNSLDHVLVRDGILPLTKFFWDHPEPKGFYSKLIIHQDCAFLVPEAWKEKVLYYRDKSFIEKSDDSSRKKLFITGMADKNCFDLKTVFSDLDKIIKEKEIEEAHLCLFNNNWRVSQMHREEDGNYFEIIKGLTLAFGEKLQFRKSDEVQISHFGDFYFWDLNTYPFFYADSFVKHHVLSSGGESIRTENTSFSSIEESHIEKLSPYHGYEIISGEVDDKDLRKNIANKLRVLSQIIEDDEKELSDRLEYYPHPQICTDELKSFAQYICKKCFAKA